MRVYRLNNFNDISENEERIDYRVNANKKDIKDMLIDELVKNLEDNGFTIETIDDMPDSIIKTYMAENGIDILLSNDSMARWWYFKNLYSMKDYLIKLIITTMLKF